MSAGFLTPLTDLGVMTSSRSLLGSNNPLCSQIQLDFNDCLEAYGYQRAREKCEKFYIDLMECWTFRKQKERYLAIQKERMKKYKSGELPKQFEDGPPMDSLIYS